MSFANANAAAALALPSLENLATVREEHILLCCDAYPSEVVECLQQIDFGELRIRENKHPDWKLKNNLTREKKLRMYFDSEKEEPSLRVIALKTCVNCDGSMNDDNTKALMNAYGRKTDSSFLKLLDNTDKGRLRQLEEQRQREQPQPQQRLLLRGEELGDANDEFFFMYQQQQQQRIEGSNNDVDADGAAGNGDAPRQNGDTEVVVADAEAGVVAEADAVSSFTLQADLQRANATIETLQRQLAEKEREAADLRHTLAQRESELESLLPQQEEYVRRLKRKFENAEAIVKNKKEEVKRAKTKLSEKNSQIAKEESVIKEIKVETKEKIERIEAESKAKVTKQYVKLRLLNLDQESLACTFSRAKHRLQESKEEKRLIRQCCWRR